MAEPILALGADVEHPRIERAAFNADATLDGRELVLLDPASVPALWGHVAPGVDGKLSTNAETDGGYGLGLIELLRRRRREVTAMLAAGGTVVCFLRPVGLPLYVRRRTARGPAAVILHAYSWLPDDPALTQLVIAAAPGREPRPAAAGHPVCALIHAQGAEAAYEAIIANEQLRPQWRVAATDRLGRPVAFEVAIGHGRLLFVPPVAAPDAAARGGLIVQHLAPALAVEAEPEPEPAQATPAPPWLGGCLLPGQAELGSEVAELSERVEQLQAELAEARAQHDELTEINRLLYAAHAEELAAAAAPAFRRLGFEVAAADEACLVLFADERNAVVAASAGLAAIESDPYWTLVRRFEGIDEPPAGIVLGNGGCDLPPDERDVVFSDLLRRGAEHRGFGLVASTDLHRAVAALIERPDDPDLRRSLRHAILDATGPCDLSAIIESRD